MLCIRCFDLALARANGRISAGKEHSRSPSTFHAGDDRTLVGGSISVSGPRGNFGERRSPALDASNTPYTPQLQPATVDNFVVTVQGAPRQLTFIADGNGVYTYIRSRPYLATRTSGNP